MRKIFYFAATLRPKQWFKNIFIFAPVLFGYLDFKNLSLHLVEWGYLRNTCIAFLLFSLIAGCIYVFNDIADREKDRLHPKKKNRPIAAGKLDIPTAMTGGILLLALSLLLAWRLSSGFLLICLIYIGLNLFYSLLLKELVIIDVMVIAFDFVLRVMAGAAAFTGGRSIYLSPWILISTFLVALFMALIKRRQELIKLGDPSQSNHARGTLKIYTVSLLDQMISISTATTLIAYIMYVLSPDVQEKFHTQKLFYTVPFVIFGIFRYLFLSYSKEEGESPTEIIYTDLPFTFNLFLWIVVFIYLVKFSG